MTKHNARFCVSVALTAEQVLWVEKMARAFHYGYHESPDVDYVAIFMAGNRPIPLNAVEIAIMKDTLCDFRGCDLEFEREGHNVIISSGRYGNIDYTAALLRACLKHFNLSMSISFQWADTETGGAKYLYGGGAVAFTKDKVVVRSTAELQLDLVKALISDEPFGTKGIYQPPPTAEVADGTSDYNTTFCVALTASEHEFQWLNALHEMCASQDAAFPEMGFFDLHSGDPLEKLNGYFSLRKMRDCSLALRYEDGDIIVGNEHHNNVEYAATLLQMFMHYFNRRSGLIFTWTYMNPKLRGVTLCDGGISVTKAGWSVTNVVELTPINPGSVVEVNWS